MAEPLPAAAADSGSNESGRAQAQSVLDKLPRVSGDWGSGRLLSGKLFTVLLTDDNRVVRLRTSDVLCGRTWDFGAGAGVSAGAAAVSVTSGSTLRPADLFAAADRAQYIAKHGRLSSTVMADDFPPILDPQDA